MSASSEAAAAFVESTIAHLAQRGIPIALTLEQRDRIATKIEHLALDELLHRAAQRSAIHADPPRRSKGGATT